MRRCFFVNNQSINHGALCKYIKLWLCGLEKWSFIESSYDTIWINNVYFQFAHVLLNSNMRISRVLLSTNWKNRNSNLRVANELIFIFPQVQLKLCETKNSWKVWLSILDSNVLGPEYIYTKINVCRLIYIFFPKVFVFYFISFVDQKLLNCREVWMTEDKSGIKISKIPKKISINLWNKIRKDKMNIK